MKFDRRQTFHPIFFKRLTSLFLLVSMLDAFAYVIMFDKMFDVFAQMILHATFRTFPHDLASNILSNNEFELSDRMIDSFAQAFKPDLHTPTLSADF